MLPSIASRAGSDRPVSAGALCRSGDRPRREEGGGEDVVEWLIEIHASMVGVDFVTPDMPFDIRRRDFQYPVHRAPQSGDPDRREPEPGGGCRAALLRGGIPAADPGG